VNHKFHDLFGTNDLCFDAKHGLYEICICIVENGTLNSSLKIYSLVNKYVNTN
jgi:hypothetical protein